MDRRFPQYDELDLPKVAEEVLNQWEAEGTFAQSLELRKDAPPFVFYEGPPSANGLPGIHHVMARAIKDIFCRYQTQKGHRVDRKAGWDTHGCRSSSAWRRSSASPRRTSGRRSASRTTTRRARRP
jgi:isoleucyl-tRNA synthetase